MFMDTVASQIPSRWKKFAIAIGLNYSQIEAIEMHRLGDPMSCFSDVYHHWQEMATADDPVSWASIATVLRSHIVGEERLAYNIEHKLVD